MAFGVGQPLQRRRVVAAVRRHQRQPPTGEADGRLVAEAMADGEGFQPRGLRLLAPCRMVEHVHEVGERDRARDVGGPEQGQRPLDLLQRGIDGPAMERHGVADAQQRLGTPAVLTGKFVQCRRLTERVRGAGQGGARAPQGVGHPPGVQRTTARHDLRACRAVQRQVGELLPLLEVAAAAGVPGQLGQHRSAGRAVRACCGTVSEFEEAAAQRAVAVFDGARQQHQHVGVAGQFVIAEQRCHHSCERHAGCLELRPRAATEHFGQAVHVAGIVQQVDRSVQLARRGVGTRHRPTTWSVQRLGRERITHRVGKAQPTVRPTNERQPQRDRVFQRTATGQGGGHVLRQQGHGGQTLQPGAGLHRAVVEQAVDEVGHHLIERPGTQASVGPPRQALPHHQRHRRGPAARAAKDVGFQGRTAAELRIAGPLARSQPHQLGDLGRGEAQVVGTEVECVRPCTEVTQRRRDLAAGEHEPAAVGEVRDEFGQPVRTVEGESLHLVDDHAQGFTAHGQPRSQLVDRGRRRGPRRRVSEVGQTRVAQRFHHCGEHGIGPRRTLEQHVDAREFAGRGQVLGECGLAVATRGLQQAHVHGQRPLHQGPPPEATTRSRSHRAHGNGRWRGSATVRTPTRPRRVVTCCRGACRRRR